VSSDGLILFGFLGLVFTVGPILLIVLLVRRFKRMTDTGKVFAILGILALLPFILLGLVFGGCAVSGPSHF
jgi:hypothetical protein